MFHNLVRSAFEIFEEIRYIFYEGGLSYNVSHVDMNRKKKKAYIRRGRTRYNKINLFHVLNEVIVTPASSKRNELLFERLFCGRAGLVRVFIEAFLLLVSYASHRQEL
jgi:hypothetical protein